SIKSERGVPVSNVGYQRVNIEARIDLVSERKPLTTPWRAALKPSAHGHQGRDGCYIPPVAAKGERNPDVSGALAIGSLGSIKPPILIVE
ncbi:MAG: hypothetical protein WA773_05200, partial [Bradyrhizobium sp.]